MLGGPKEVPAMRPYEVMVIFDADLEEETIRSAVERSRRAHRVEGRRDGPDRLVGQATARLRGEAPLGGLLRGPAGEGRARGDGRAAPVALPLRRRHPPQGAADPRAGLREARGHAGAPRRRLDGRRHATTTTTRRPSAASPDVRRTVTMTAKRHGGTTMADNTITIVGNLTRDPEIRYTASGQANARLGIAVSRRWQNRQTNEWEERTSFFNVVCLGRHGREHQRHPGQGHPGHRERPARAALAGRPSRARSAASSRSSPTRSVRACAGRRPR